MCTLTHPHHNRLRLRGVWVLIAGVFLWMCTGKCLVLLQLCSGFIYCFILYLLSVGVGLCMCVPHAYPVPMKVRKKASGLLELESIEL